jgi:diacylglycerol kinase family enzyme
VHHADGAVVDDGYLTIVLNTNPYTYLGNRPLNLAPEATLDRGLTALTVRTMSFVPFLRVIGSALVGGGGLRRSRWVDRRTDVAALTVRAYGPVPYQVDGDHLGDAETLEFRHEPDVLDLVLP